MVDKLKLPLQTAADVKRTPVPGATGVLANPKFLDALFSNDVVRNKRNTEAIDVGANTLVSGRVVKYEAAHQLPLADVKARIRDRLIVEQSAAAARKLGEARLAALRAAPTTALTEAPITVSRAQPHDLQRPLLDDILKAPATPLPAFVGADLGDQGYAVVKITKVLGRDPVVADIKAAQSQYAQAWGDAEAQAYYAALKSRFKTEIKPGVLPPADAASGVAVSAN